MLKIVCEFATCLPKLSGFKKATNFIIYEANGKNIIVPNILNERCNNAAFFAVLFAPNEAIIAVTHVPILHPKTIGNAIFMSIVPADANAGVMFFDLLSNLERIGDHANNISNIKEEYTHKIYI